MHGSRSGRFRLMQYFTVMSLLAFGLVAVTLYFLQRSEEVFFEAVQHRQSDFFAEAQAELVRKQKEAALSDLLRIHEASHVTLTRLFANGLWESHFAPLVARVEPAIERCRAAAEPARRECFAGLGRQIRSLPGFAEVDSAVHAMTRNSTVFKIKVYDLRGITVYSSELAQIGEDKSDNLGWKSAVKGRAASELVHRDRFSAFEGTVENRDLIQSYLPVSPPGGTTSGVFEIYSDVTPFLQQIHAVSTRIADLTAANQAKVEDAAEQNQRKVESSSRQFFAVVGTLLAALYVALLVLVRNAQRIIDEQARAREIAALREQRWHREKMALLATMAAHVSHEVGNPLAVITGLAHDMARAQAAGEPVTDQPRLILEQASRLAEMTRHITEFATARRETSEPLDVNQMAKSVCDFLAFDHRFRGVRINLRPGDRLPAAVGIPDHLNEVLMNLLQARAEAGATPPTSGGHIVVETGARDKELMIRIGCDCASPGQACTVAEDDSRLAAARLRVEGMGGRLVWAGSTIEIFLRSLAPEPAG